MKKGILGGTFSPVHKGHILMAGCAMEELGLDCVLFMPTGNPPHKSDILDIGHRLNMLRLCVQDVPGFEVSDFESKRSGIIYTADTLRLLKDMYPDDDYTFIIGGDSFFNITSWHTPEKIFEYAQIAVCIRGDADNKKMLAQKEMLENKYAANIKLLHFKPVDISSNEIRRAVKSGNENEISRISRYMPAKVLEYIKKEGLYL